MKLWTFVFLNTMLNRVGKWGFEAMTVEEAVLRFRETHRDFCQIQTINGRKFAEYGLL